MKFLRKFDTFLLENHPILWRSKVFYLLATGALLWVAFYLVGYAITDLNTLLNHSIDRRYEDTFAILFHVILVIIILSFWALHFYKKNAIRHYYPLKRFYLLKLFFSILIGISPLIMLSFPFQAGVRAKARDLVDLESLQKEVHTINLALAFLPTNSSDYSIDRKTTPAPFPVSEIIRLRSDGSFTNVNLFIKDSVGDTMLYNPSEHPENNILIDKVPYQFLRTENRYDQNECSDDYFRLITRFYQPDTSFDLHIFGLLNYSNVEYSSFFSRDDFSYSNDYDQETRTMFQQFYAPTIHRWVHQKQEDSIQFIVQQFQEILNKYSIKSVLNPQLIASVHAHYDYHGNYLSFVNTSLYYKKYYKSELNVNSKTIISHLESYDKKNPFAYDKYHLDYLIRNSVKAYYHDQDDEFILGLLIIAISLSLLFFLFDVTPFIQFLIAIPVMGVLMIGLGLLSALISYGYDYDYYSAHQRESYILLLFCITFSLILIFCFLTLHVAYFNKKLSGVFLNLGYFMAPALPVLILATIVEFNRHFIYTRCGGFHLVYNEQLRDILMDPYLLVGVSLLGAICYFPLIRKYYARKE